MTSRTNSSISWNWQHLAEQSLKLPQFTALFGKRFLSIKFYNSHLSDGDDDKKVCSTLRCCVKWSAKIGSQSLTFSHLLSFQSKHICNVQKMPSLWKQYLITHSFYRTQAQLLSNITKQIRPTQTNLPKAKFPNQIINLPNKFINLPNQIYLIKPTKQNLPSLPNLSNQT